MSLIYWNVIQFSSNSWVTIIEKIKIYKYAIHYFKHTPIPKFLNFKKHQVEMINCWMNISCISQVFIQGTQGYFRIVNHT